MWNFIETFYHEQGEEDTGYVTEKYLQGLAQQVPGLNLAKWTSDRSNHALASPGRKPTPRRPTTPASTARRRS